MWRSTNRSPPSGIRSLAAIIQLLVILCIGKQKIGVPIDERMDRAFGTGEKFFEYDTGNASTEPFSLDHIVNCVFGVDAMIGNDYSFAECQTVCLHSNREPELG